MAVNKRGTTVTPKPGPLGDQPVKEPEEKLRIEVLEEDTIINGHKLPAGTVIELPAADIDSHRDHGLRFGPVDDDDDRDVYDVSEPWAPEQNPADAPEVAE